MQTITTSSTRWFMKNHGIYGVNFFPSGKSEARLEGVKDLTSALLEKNAQHILSCTVGRIACV